MYNYRWQSVWLACGIFILSGCATNQFGQSQPYTSELASANLPLYQGQAPYSSSYDESKYLARMPQTVNYGERVIVIDPKVFAWGAYDENGQLIRAGIATSGADYCADVGRPCRTRSGSFRIFSLGDETCVSKKYPLGEGGSLMPYCMFFNGGESLHGSPDPMLVEANVSHGCVRLRIPDAAWIRYDFARIGTKVVVLPY